MYELVLCDASGGTFQVTLPTIAGAADIGKLVCVKRYNAAAANKVTIVAAGGQSIIEAVHDLEATYYWHSQVYSVISATAWCIVADYYLEMAPE